MPQLHPQPCPRDKGPKKEWDKEFDRVGEGTLKVEAVQEEIQNLKEQIAEMDRQLDAFTAREAAEKKAEALS